jgi:hypothetical protein
MDILTVDMETFYGDNFTLSKLTTEAYIRDPRFETILCGFKVNDERGFWVPRDDVPKALADLKLQKKAVLAHHAHFDGLILSHHYGLAPRLWLDTLGMARALYGQHGRLSLAKLAERHGIGAKGEEVLLAKNLHFKDFGPQMLERYGRYCVNDCDLEWQLFNIMAPHFSKQELLLNDRVIRMFTEPRFKLDQKTLQDYATMLSVEKQTLMLQAGVQKTDLMSNDNFAECLRDLGIEPPKKISPTWAKDPRPPGIPEEQGGKGMAKMTWAFAKSDAEMQELQEHPDERVQFLVEARLKNKTTIAEKGAMRLIEMGGRGLATVYLKYSGAGGTHRLSGGDSLNWQSFKRGSPLRDGIMADDGYVCCVSDSSTIEARLLDWLAGQDDMVEVYRKADAKTGPDMYCVIGGRIYGRVITKATDPEERQMGKVAKLGLGFGMGAGRFQIAVRGQAKDKAGKPLRISAQFSEQVVGIYRESHPQVRKLWKRCEGALDCIVRGVIGTDVDFRGVVKTCKDGLVFPGGIKILYPDLKKVPIGDGRYEYEFWNGKHRERIYGAKVTENIIQCLARIVVMYQCLDADAEVSKVGASWAHSQHDEGIFVSPAWEGPWVLERIMAHMRCSPSWAPDLPVNCEGGLHRRYGKAKV